MKYYDLKNNRYVLYNNSNKGLKFLYGSVIGRVILKILLCKLNRGIYAKYMDSRLSKYKIKKFIKKNNINISDYEDKVYNSFNDFFVRKIKSEKRIIGKGLVAVADSKLFVYKIDDNSSFKIKNSIYSIDELIKADGSIYKNGYALVFRLSLDDYHHYIYLDDGVVLSSKNIDGFLHTVQAVAFDKYKVFHENSRCVTFLDCKNYGKVSYVEVGAMMVGKIVNENITKFKKGEEKGHFEYGGSTVILLFEKDKININKNIIKNSELGIETIVKLGESLE